MVCLFYSSVFLFLLWNWLCLFYVGAVIYPNYWIRVVGPPTVSTFDVGDDTNIGVSAPSTRSWRCPPRAVRRPLAPDIGRSLLAVLGGWRYGKHKITQTFFWRVFRGLHNLSNYFQDHVTFLGDFLVTVSEKARQAQIRPILPKTFLDHVTFFFWKFLVAYTIYLLSNYLRIMWLFLGHFFYLPNHVTFFWNFFFHQFF